MTDQERYRAAFAVQAPEQAVQQVLDRARSGVQRRRIAPRMVLVAALIGALLVTSVGAEVNSGAVTNLLAPYFGSARTELLEEIGRPVGASASADGYTLTADAIIGDRYNMQVLYTLTRDDGQPIPEDVRFMDIGTEAGDHTSCSTVFSYLDAPTPNEMRFYQKYGTDGSFSRRIRTSFGRLAVCDGLEVAELLAEGPWELSFTRRYPDTTRKVPVDGLTVTGLPGHSCNIQALSYSCMGVTITGTTPYFEEEEDFDQILSVSVTLKDGSILPLSTSFSADWSGPSPVWQFKAYARYRDEHGLGLLDLDEITTITLCDTTVPVP